MIEVLKDEGLRRAIAVIVSVELDHVVYEETTSGGIYTRGRRKLTLEVEPADGECYEAVLELGPDEPMVPAQPGTRMPVLVDADDPQQLALPDDRWFVMPGGVVWTPPREPAYAGPAAQFA
jgi:hypothetical protein